MRVAVRALCSLVAFAVVAMLAVAGGSSASAGTPITLAFATWNVCKVDCAAPAPSWDIRRGRVAQNVLEAGVDVLGVQEATNNPTSFTKTQLEDVANILAPAGLAMVSYGNESNECKRPRDAAGQLAGPSPCENTAALFYRTSTVEQVSLPNGMPSAGVVQQGSIAPGSDPGNAYRSSMWAYLSPKGANKPFLAISIHDDSAKTPEAEGGRVLLGQSLTAWARNWNAVHGMAGVPVMLMADLNSYAKRQPNGVQKILVDSGWKDAWDVKSRRNIEYSTINYNPLLPDGSGFPVKPYKFKKTKKNKVGAATRIDYVMGLDGLTPIDYEVVIHLNADGTFNQAYQGSDHQMVRTVWQFPA